jgi:hypothetical protein
MMKITNEYEHPPVFHPVGALGSRPIDYDSDSNLIVWRSLERYVLFTKEDNRVRENFATYKVSPAGTIVSTTRYETEERYLVGNLESVYIFDQLRLATGRGFAHHLTAITRKEETSLSTNTRKLEASGTFAESFKGKWGISVDEAEDYLIREARFPVDGADKPFVVVTNSGLVECLGMKIAASGMLRLGPYQANFEVKSLKRLDSEFDSRYAEIIKHVNAPLPPGNSEIIDRREGKPKRILVK